MLFSLACVVVYSTPSCLLGLPLFLLPTLSLPSHPSLLSTFFCNLLLLFYIYLLPTFLQIPYTAFTTTQEEKRRNFAVPTTHTFAYLQPALLTTCFYHPHAPAPTMLRTPHYAVLFLCCAVWLWYGGSLLCHYILGGRQWRRIPYKTSLAVPGVCCERRLLVAGHATTTPHTCHHGSPTLPTAFSCLVFTFSHCATAALPSVQSVAIFLYLIMPFLVPHTHSALTPTTFFTYLFLTTLPGWWDLIPGSYMGSYNLQTHLALPRISHMPPCRARSIPHTIYLLTPPNLLYPMVR